MVHAGEQVVPLVWLANVAVTSVGFTSGTAMPMSGVPPVAFPIATSASAARAGGGGAGRGTLVRVRGAVVVATVRSVVRFVDVVRAVERREADVRIRVSAQCRVDVVGEAAREPRAARERGRVGLELQVAL